MGKFKKARGLVLVVAALPALAFESRAQAPDAERGKQIASSHCARCHVIPGRNNMGIGSTPSFKIMVQSKSGDWRDKFEAFFSLAPHPAFVTIKELRTQRSGPAIAAPIVLSLREIDDLMAYVDILAAEYRKP
ncbi:MAG: cytochrome c [Alphaproteobacteria bacterium]|nr:cytochrome c [Alphaproteobacteria bacterium]